MRRVIIDMDWLDHDTIDALDAEFKKLGVLPAFGKTTNKLPIEVVPTLQESLGNILDDWNFGASSREGTINDLTKLIHRHVNSAVRGHRLD